MADSGGIRRQLRSRRLRHRRRHQLAAASGFQVAQVGKGRTVIEFSGTAGQVKQAFGTAIHQFDVKGEQHWANVSDPSIPTALAPVVAGVDSLHNFLKKAHNSYVGTVLRKQPSSDLAST